MKIGQVILVGSVLSLHVTLLGQLQGRLKHLISGQVELSAQRLASVTVEMDELFGGHLTSMKQLSQLLAISIHKLFG